MKLSLINLYEQTMKYVETYQVHNNSSKLFKRSLMNFHEPIMSWIDNIKLKNNHYYSSSPRYELLELNHEYHQVIKCLFIFIICHELFSINSLWTQSWTRLMNHRWMFLNVHKHSSTLITWWTSSHRGIIIHNIFKILSFSFFCSAFCEGEDLIIN